MGQQGSVQPVRAPEALDRPKMTLSGRSKRTRYDWGKTTLSDQTKTTWFGGRKSC